MNNLDYNLIIDGIIFVCGVLIILGNTMNMKCFVDPPEELWPLWWPSAYKKFAGPKAAKVITYITGIMLTCAGLGFFWKDFKGW